MSGWIALSSYATADSAAAKPDTMSVHEFLKLHMGSRAGKPTEQCKKFVLRNCHKLLDIALNPSEGEHSKKAFYLLTTSSAKTVEALIKDDTFFMKATEILASKEIDTVVISRLSCLFGHILTNLKGSLTECICFVMQFLKYVEDPSVFGLFCLILDANAAVKEIPTLLAKSSFASLIVTEFTEEASNEKIANLVAIVKLCLKHRILGASFRNERVMNRLISLLDSIDMMVLNQVWQALGALCCDATATKMSGLLEDALESVRDVNSLHMYHIFACDFIGKMLYYAPGCVNAEAKRRIVNVALELMEKYPNSTNLMGSVFRILRSGVKNHVLLQAVMQRVVPVLVFHAGATERTALAANATQFIADMEESRKNNKAENQALKDDKVYSKFTATKLAVYLALQKKEYGGPVAKYVKKSKSWDNNLATHAQEVKAA